MKLKRHWQYKYPIHFCGWDRECRKYGASADLYLHFLEKENGDSVVIRLWKRK